MNPQDTKDHHNYDNQSRDLQIPARDQSPHVPQRETAANILRDKVAAIYEHDPPNQLNQSSSTTNTSSTYNRTYNATPAQLQEYHSAWQQYYQQYYQRYYVQQLHLQRQQQALLKAEDAGRQPQEQIISHESDDVSGTSESHKQQVLELKNNLLGKVKKRAKKVRQSHHFMPIISALAVGLLFLFLQYNRVFFAEVKAYVSPGSTVNENDTVLVDPSANANVGPEPKLIIPKINVNIKVVYDITSLEDKPVQEGLNHGVVHYKLPGANALPGQVGNVTILGHSSNDIFDPGDYKFAFVLLDRLQAGDIAYLHYEGKRYIYRVTDKKVISPTEFAALQSNSGKPMLTLVTCTPPGTALKRLLVFAEQISPDPATATQPQSGETGSNEPADLPGNSPTLFERIRDFFF
jgi:sortase A